MNKVSEISLATIKKVLDSAIKKGGIFYNTEQVVDAINAYNYLAKVCGDAERMTQELMKQNHQPETVNSY